MKKTLLFSIFFFVSATCSMPALAMGNSLSSDNWKNYCCSQAMLYNCAMVIRDTRVALQESCDQQSCSVATYDCMWTAFSCPIFCFKVHQLGATSSAASLKMK
jgi:hypothetical protein